MFNHYRVIVFPTNRDFMSSLPPELSIPEDNIWEVFVTVVRWVSCTKSEIFSSRSIRSATNVSCRLTGSPYSELYDNLISDMDLHYFDAGQTGVRARG